MLNNTCFICDGKYQNKKYIKIVIYGDACFCVVTKESDSYSV